MKIHFFIHNLLSLICIEEKRTWMELLRKRFSHANLRVYALRLYYLDDIITCNGITFTQCFYVFLCFVFYIRMFTVYAAFISIHHK